MRKGLAVGLCALMATMALGCNDPYKDYTVTDLQPKTADASIFGKDFNFDNPNYGVWNKLDMVKTYADYQRYDVNLGYTEGYFENNCLLVVLTTSCTSDGFSFVEIKEHENKLYPVIERNDIKADDAVTTDIIYSFYYVEVPAETYQIGEVIYRDR